MKERSAKRRMDLTLDERGTFVDSLFFRVSIGNAYEPRYVPPPWRQRNQILESSLSNKRDAIAVDVYETERAEETEFRCENGKDHAKQRLFLHVVGERFNGRVLNEFVRDERTDFLFVSEVFASRIKESNLKGWRFDTVKVKDHRTETPITGILHLQCVGRNCQRPWSISQEINKCPFCGRGWIVCEKCGRLERQCPHCNEMMVCTEDRSNRKDEQRVSIPSHFVEERILDGSRWDGSDFVGSLNSDYFSRRVVNWLESVHAGPLSAVPIRFCTDGMSQEQVVWMKEASDWTTVKEA